MTSLATNNKDNENNTALTLNISSNNNNQIKNGDYVLLSAFGAGFTWGSMLIKWGSE